MIGKDLNNCLELMCLNRLGEQILDLDSLFQIASMIITIPRIMKTSIDEIEQTNIKWY